MESFFHIVSYIDLYEDNSKLYNVGFLKWDYRNNSHCIEISLKDVKPENHVSMILFGEDGPYFDKIKICEGRGILKNRYEGSSSGIIVNGSQISLEPVEKIKITLDENRHLCGKVTLPVEKKIKIERISEKNIEKIDTFGLKDKISTEIDEVIHQNCGKLCEIETSYVDKPDIKQEKLEDIVDRNVENYSKTIEKYVDKVENSVDKVEDRDVATTYEGSTYVENKQKEVRRESEEVIKYPVDNVRIEKPLPEDKWNQLCLKYNLVHPFPQEEGFLTITLKDFIILQEGYQKLVHNSFLLHGYYNYGHIILGKLKEEKDKYYIGVPGVYYEQEKKAARMFGFVGFEGVDKIVEKGSYGYYMIEVKL